MRNFRRPFVSLGNVNGLVLDAVGPGGRISITYGDPGGDDATAQFYAARGWTRFGVAGISRIYNQGSYR